MIVGIGIDIIELDRIEKSLAKRERFVKRILTTAEEKHYYKLRSDRRKLEFLAGRFAVKEAFAKAAGTGIGKLSFQHIEILPNSNGAPKLKVDGYEDYLLWVSLSHSEKYAIAQVIIEKK